MAAQPSRAPRQRGRGLAIAALVLGLIALLFSWIPIINILGIICGFIGLVLGLIGIFMSHRGISIAGAALSLVGIIIGFSVTGAFVSEVDEQLNTPPTVQQEGAPAQGDDADAATDTYDYRVDGSGQAMILYGTASGSGTSSSSVTETLPWSETVTVTDEGAFFVPTVTATVTGTDGTIACEIVRNGEVVASQEASGEFASVSCAGG